MSIWKRAQDYLHEQVNWAVANSVQLVDGHYTPRVGTKRTIWVGFADLTTKANRAKLERLVAAGVQRVTFTPINKAGAGGVWAQQYSMAHFVRGIMLCKELGLEVGLGPWVWCNERFMDSAGAQMAKLASSLPRGWADIDYIELDAEGSFENSCTGMMKRAKLSADQAVALAMTSLLRHIPSHIPIEATVLYFNRRAGDALLRHPRIRSATVQAYSVWFPGNSTKAVATHAKNYQPGVLQQRAGANYLAFKRERALDELHFGLGWWAQKRGKQQGVPVELRMEQPEAFRRATLASLELGVDGIAGWAFHLWNDGGEEAERLELVLRELAFIRDGGIEATPTTPKEVADPKIIHIEFGQPVVLDGARIPDGYKRIDGIDDPWSDVRSAATMLRSRNNTVVRPQKGGGPGTYTPIIIHEPDGDWYGIGLDEYHGATHVGGQRVEIAGRGIHGITVFEKIRHAA